MTDGDKGEFLIVTGMSGAGRTTVANALEAVSYTHLTLPTNREV